MNVIILVLLTVIVSSRVSESATVEELISDLFRSVSDLSTKYSDHEKRIQILEFKDPVSVNITPIVEKIRKELNEELNKQLNASLLNMQKKLNESIESVRDAYRNDTKNMHLQTVPIGFIYFQLGKQLEPNKIWPLIVWKDVSDEYTGLFFRVYGKNSTKFETIQEQDSPRLAKVMKHQGKCDVCWNSKQLNITVPSDGKISATIFSGDSAYGEGHDHNVALSFELSNAEVRPRNMPIRVWRRMS